MSDNVQVVCRFRPENKLEKTTGDGRPVRFELPTTVHFLGGHENKFTFDYVFDPDGKQSDVFDKTARPFVKQILDGYNTTIFAYGQTGSGKSHTMMGKLETQEDRGIIPRLTQEIFTGIAASPPGIEFTVKVSFIEIYMERLRDLMEPSKDNLKIREGNRGVWIQDVSEIYVSSAEEVFDILNKGQENRSIASTRMNQESSRSHSVFMASVSQRNQSTGSKKSAKLFLVDLAGSEKIQKTEAQGQTLEEAKHINKSLSALGNVINALTEGTAHVPYRDSKLTRLLSDSLGGNSKTCLITTCSPSIYNAEETLSTLRFGVRAKRIKNTPKVNAEKSIQEYKDLLAEADKKIAKQQDIIRLLEQNVSELSDQIVSLGAKPVVSNVISASSQPSSTSDSSSPSSGQPQPSSSSSSVSHGHSHDVSVVNKLQTEIEELESKITSLKDQNSQLSDRVTEKESELIMQNGKINQLLQELETYKKKLSEEEDKGTRVAEKLADYALYKKKVSLMEKEYLLRIDQLSAQNAHLMRTARPVSTSDTPSDVTPDPLSPSNSSTTTSSSSTPMHSHSNSNVPNIDVKSDSTQSTNNTTSSSSSTTTNTTTNTNLAPTSTGKTELPSTKTTTSSSTSNNSSSGPTKREEELAKENEKLMTDLQKKIQEHIDDKIKMEEMKNQLPETQGNGIDKPDLNRKSSVPSVKFPRSLFSSQPPPSEKPVTNVNPQLQAENDKMKKQISMLNSNAEYQKQLLLTRSEHILVLESALQESNAVHRKQWLKQQEEADELRKKLAEAQQMIDTLLKSSKYGSGRTERAAGGKIVIPVRGSVKRIMSGGAQHSDDNKEKKTINSGNGNNSDDESDDGNKSPTQSGKKTNSQTLPAKLIQRMPPSPIQSITNLLNRRTNTTSSTSSSTTNNSNKDNTLQPPSNSDRSSSPVNTSSTPSTSSSTSTTSSSSAFSSVSSGVKPKISNLINAFTSKTQETAPKPMTSPMSGRSITNAQSSPFVSSINNNSGSVSPAPLKAFPVSSSSTSSTNSSSPPISTGNHNRVGSKSPSPPIGSRPATPPNVNINSTGSDFGDADNVSNTGSNNGENDLTTLPPSL